MVGGLPVPAKRPKGQRDAAVRLVLYPDVAELVGDACRSSGELDRAIICPEHPECRRQMRVRPGQAPPIADRLGQSLGLPQPLDRPFLVVVLTQGYSELEAK